jgi:hypothetical protein
MSTLKLGQAEVFLDLAEPPVAIAIEDNASNSTVVNAMVPPPDSRCHPLRFLRFLGVANSLHL